MISLISQEVAMAQLIVRKLAEKIVRELKLRAAQNHRSAEEEHREILRSVLLKPAARQSLKDFLEDMPLDIPDEIFERQSDFGRESEF